MANSMKPGNEAENQLLSLGTAAARQLATTTKSVPQMQGISSRWLLKLLPWVQVSGGVYRVNRRMTYAVGDGRVTFTTAGAKVQVIPQELCELPLLRGFDDVEVLQALANRFEQKEFKAGEVITAKGQEADSICLIAHGKVNQIGAGKYGDETVIGVLADGDHYSFQALLESQDFWTFTAKAVTACTVLMLQQSAFEAVVAQAPSLQKHIEQFKARSKKKQDTSGQAAIELAAGHTGEPVLPGTYVDYETSPREYELSVAQTVLQIHSRVADLFNEPMNQTEQQLRLTVEALKERKEHELINNRDFGLLHNADLKQRIHTRSGPPTPDDMDELLSTVWKDPSFFLAHPRAIAAFGQECNRRGIYPTSVELNGNMVPAWRGIPIFPCNKIPVSDSRTSSILLMRAGEKNQGVVGLHQAGIPDEIEPSLSVRFMGINEKAIINYLVSAYFSAAVLIPDALGILESVEIGRSE
ncbi:cyclic nucleotide-binding domain-containing protein [Myxococcus sp. CA051A]|uniref:Cyclic nucleotide-binding domain-containing protein n=1 Tax=Myxococcus llanfairpwllgwyngyllgogerychwyrndrobwllllantysiliogogogochensis TaxID=2590453 RepID=A0A540X6L7_9BACT|nr:MULTISPECIES: family 2B encapsulin nanocompartment shell protein [Myxococcus]NTX00163.1 cyclic nucleotide-binding domain-containing protein [Myxococcus sp. CA040A]NTX17241.1 cyclic nucleotide-binding domain-containing protein [Myxococcus sp. CA056]NTX38290.1 cyclic nucleotide-binding domain-containing protein [Myxococcus sp. CA033]NTX49699.1 cyclic nucleotide-binding domain-containing protein [Myxococcus sp. CA039A]NTX65473.1 cyclic nucleotide-binding domain-containing protein [Myxococcus s